VGSLVRCWVWSVISRCIPWNHTLKGTVHKITHHSLKYHRQVDLDSLYQS
jgi:hypothetical protein